MNSIYRADIDGLRGIAVLAVVLFHTGYASFGGGYVGVDVFFVISGYLITSIILKEVQRQEFSVARFYERRVRRIFPALFLTICLTLIAGAVLFIPADFKNLGKSAAAVTLFASNILFWKESGYFDTAASFKPLLHTWSLAVEEQFYIVFPLLLIAIRRLFRARFALCLSVIAAVSLAASLYNTYRHPVAAFYLAPTRAWELLLGGLIACNVFPGSSYTRRNVLAAAGLALIAVSIFALDSQTAFPGLAALLPTVGAALIIYAGSAGTTVIGRALSARPLVFIGLISYSLYLLHWPVLTFARYFAIVELTLTQILTLLAATLVLSTLSWRYVEQPFRSNQTLNRNHLFALAGTVMAATVAIGFFIDTEEGMPRRFDDTVFNDPLTNSAWLSWTRCNFRVPGDPEGLCSLGSPKTEPSFLLWGDSHAAMLATGVDQSAARQSASGYVATANACPPMLGSDQRDPWEDPMCVEFNKAIFRYIQERPSLKTIFLAARWTKYGSGPPYGTETAFKIEPSKWGTTVDGNSNLIDLRLKQTVGKLLETGRAAVLIEPVPEIGSSVLGAYGIASWTGRDLNNLIAPARKEYDARNHAILTTLNSLGGLSGVRIVKLSERMCDTSTCRVIESGWPLYTDNNHLSIYASQSLSPLFDGLLKSH